MQIRHRRNKIRSLVILGCLAIVLGRWSVVAEAAVTAAQPAGTTSSDVKPKKKGLDEILQTPFTYRRENRSDPFKPFLTPETGPAVIAPEAEAPLTGMQLFEPGQLTLVTILFSGQETLAMVEDSTGMGHIIRVHDKIGRRGEVKAIVPNAVIIEEWSLTTSGTKRFTTNEMVLRKEGDLE